jgi:hypothetical protein
MEAGREGKGGRDRDGYKKSEEQIIYRDLLLDGGQHHQLSERKTGLKPATLSLEG